MKNYLLKLIYIVVVTTPFFVNAQTISNADFENWTSGVPTGWSSLLPTIGVSQSSDKQNGNSSVKFTMDPFVVGIILTVNDGNMLSSHTVSSFLNGYIKADLSPSDTFLAEAYYKRNTDQAIAGGIDVTSISRSTWTPFHVTLFKPTGYIPDSFAVTFELNTFSSTSWVMIDNLSLSNTSIGNELGTARYNGIKTISNQNFHSTFFPNPTNGSSEINFSLISTSNINVKIYDVTGRCVKTIFDEKMNSGDQKIKLNVEELMNGVYFYTITGDVFFETKKFIISK